MACNSPAFRFRKYLMVVGKGLTPKDLKKLCFLCKDLLTTQCLEKVKRGLDLFLELEKLMELTKEDVSIIVELMELIWRKDLVKKTLDTWDESCTYSKKQRISPYRRLLLAVAQEVTKGDLDDVKHFAKVYITGNIEEVQDMLEVISNLEKGCVISPSDVDILAQILPNEKDKQKVYAYKRDVLGQPIPASSSPEERPAPESSIRYAERTNTPLLLQQTGNPHVMGAPTGSSHQYADEFHKGPLQQQAGQAQNPICMGTPHWMDPNASQQYANAYHMNQFAVHPQYHQPVFYPTNYPIYNQQYPYLHQLLPHGWPPGNAAPPIHHHTGPQPSQVPQRQPPGNDNFPRNRHVQQTPPRSEREPMENTSPPDPQQYASGQIPSLSSSNTLAASDRVTVAASHPMPILPNQQYGSNLPDSAKLTEEPNTRDNMHNVQPHSAIYDSCNQDTSVPQRQDVSRDQEVSRTNEPEVVIRTNEPQLAQGVNRSAAGGGEPVGTDHRQEQNVSDLQRNFGSLKVEDDAKAYSSNAADLVAMLDSIDTFPDSSSEGNEASGGSTSNSAVERLLQFDNPDSEPSETDIPPWDENYMQHLERGPTRYKMSSKPRGLCIIINNENFARSREAVAHPVESQICREPQDDRPGSIKDTMKLIKLFHEHLGFKLIRCKNNRTATEMFDDLDAVRKMDHSKFDCFICCIMTHGRLGEIYGVDGASIEIRELTGLFNGVKCQSLVGKPKVFFINACQGNARQLPATLLQQDSPGNNMVTIPNESDFLLCLSTVPGYASFRSPDKGSWYVISLEAIMKKHHNTVDAYHLLCMVNNHLSKCCDAQGFKQCAFISSSLRQVLYFTNEG